MYKVMVSYNGVYWQQCLRQIPNTFVQFDNLRKAVHFFYNQIQNSRVCYRIIGHDGIIWRSYTPEGFWNFRKNVTVDWLREGF